MGHNDDTLVDFIEVFLLLTRQVSQNPLGDVFHITKPLPNIFILNLVKKLSNVLD